MPYQSDPRTELARLIRAERGKRDWNQIRLGQHFSVNQATVSRWERGDESPRRDQLRQMAEFLGVDEELLFQLKYDTPTPDDLEVIVRIVMLESKVAKLEGKFADLSGNVGALVARAKLAERNRGAGHSEQ